MKKAIGCSLALAPLLSILWGSNTWAQTVQGEVKPEAPQSEDETAPQKANTPKAKQQATPQTQTQAEAEVVILGAANETTLSGASLMDPRAPSTGDRLDQELGVSVARRGAAGSEPFLRGWGGDRVMTQNGPLPLSGACPGKMDPPLSYVRPTGATRLRLVRSIAPVIDGPWGTGGRIVASTDPGPAPARLSASLGGTFDSSRLGGSGFAALGGGNDFYHLRGSVEAIGYGDYTSPSGILVPAGQTELGGSASLGFTGDRDHSGWVTASYARHQNIDYPALPMDLVSTDGLISDANHRWAPGGRIISAIETSVGVQFLDHVMDNANRPNRGTLEARTDSKVRNGALRVKIETAVSEGHFLDWGGDAMLLSSNAWRERHLVMPDQTFDDHIWPNAIQGNAGAFAQWHAQLNKKWHTRLGARVDVGHMDIGGVDDPALGGTVGDAYVRFYGQEARETAATTIGGASNVIARFTDDGGFGFYVGLGLSTRPGAVTERYFAFAPAPGGFLVGNPTLTPEKRGTLESGVNYQTDWLELSLVAHGSRAGDYILQTTLAMQDINGDGVDDRVMGFHNVDAWILGGEFEVVPQFFTYLSLPTTLELLWGENSTDARPLPEIAPWEVRTALRAQGGGRVALWSELGVRIVGKQERIDENFPEDATAAFVVARAAAGLRIKRWIDLAVSVENIANKEYSEHLTRPAIQPVGGLTPGQNIPAQGRRVLLTARSSF